MITVKKKLFFAIILILVLVVLTGGIIVAQFVLDREEQVITDSRTSQSSSQNIIEPPSIVGAQTEQQKAVLTNPQTDDPSEQQRYKAQIEKEAVSSDTLNITYCSPNPLVLKIKNKSTVTLVNNGNEDHIFVINEKLKYPVPSKGSLRIPIDFAPSPGIYGYGCDQSTDAVGKILVTQ